MREIKMSGFVSKDDAICSNGLISFQKLSIFCCEQFSKVDISRFEPLL
jgi:hypothetical protein